MEKFYEENCLYEQHYHQGRELTIREMIEQAIAKLGENISIRALRAVKVGEVSRRSDGAGNGARRGQGVI